MLRGSSGVARVVLAVASVALIVVARPARAQFTSYPRNSHNILEGNWQSCRESDGRYSERVYDHVVNGIAKFEVHMGPRREFAIFEGVQDEHRAHDSPANLLRPKTSYRMSSFSCGAILIPTSRSVGRLVHGLRLLRATALSTRCAAGVPKTALKTSFSPAASTTPMWQNANA